MTIVSAIANQANTSKRVLFNTDIIGRLQNVETGMENVHVYLSLRPGSLQYDWALGSRVDARSEAQRADGSRTKDWAVTLRQRDEMALIEVHNQGVPIPPAEQASLFSNRRWKSAGRTQKGWGLGLFLVHGMIEAMRGSIQVESTLASGTTFRVSLPIQVQAKASTPLAG